MNARLLSLATLVVVLTAPASRAHAASPPAPGPTALVQSLAGTWRLQLDPADVGLASNWPALPLPAEAVLELPGTTDLAGYGAALDPHTLRYPVPFPYTRFPGVDEPSRADARGFLVRRHVVLGPVWYEREIHIPAAWTDAEVVLHLERVLWRSDVWIDGRHAGTADSLATPHEHALGRLTPGPHRLTLRIDNRMQVNLSTITHAYGPETQSRWNGVVGRIELSARPALALRRFDAYPDPETRSVRVVAFLTDPNPAAPGGRIEVRLWREESSTLLGRAEVPVPPATDGRLRPVEVLLPLDAAPRRWDEFHPVRHRLEVRVHPDSGTPSSAEARIGFRILERRGRALLINGRQALLRGTLDCAVFPKTGHPPMDLGAWERILRVVQAHGFNHVRFHTWCPPEAAFEAADRLGLYLMPETAAWIDDWTRATLGQPAPIGRDPAVSAFVRAEIDRIADAYGNHPSFAVFCIGNEFGMEGTDWDEAARWTAAAKARDPRRLYTTTTARRSLDPDDLWVTHAVHGHRARGVGPAQTDWDFAAAAAATPLPVLAHETGQRPVFPEWDRLLPKFTGPLLPLNYARLQQQWIDRGLTGQERPFAEASARFQLVQYKAEHEAMRRTSAYAGYQLLMLNDFTGQSEALVGILDPFWESKGVVTPADVRQWNAPLVPLARFARYTWPAGDTFRARLEVSHFGPRDLNAAVVRWRLDTDDGRSLGRGRFEPRRLPAGALSPVGEIEVPLTGLTEAAALRLQVRVGRSRNAWRLWAYPTASPADPPGIRIARRWTPDVENALAAGERILLLAHGLAGPYAASTGFESVYWSAGWWGNAFSSFGVLCDPRHPALAGFPNQGHSDWQWHALTTGATTFRLEGFPNPFRPIVQAVPDFHYPGLLAQVFEARVGPGRILVCGYDLAHRLDERHAARQFRRSLLDYAASPQFRPDHALTPSQLRDLLQEAAPTPGDIR